MTEIIAHAAVRRETAGRHVAEISAAESISASWEGTDDSKLGDPLAFWRGLCWATIFGVPFWALVYWAFVR